MLFLTTARFIFKIQDAPKSPTALDVIVTGHQFWWEFRYPQLGIVTANELHIPLSTDESPRPSHLKLLSVDVNHGFWIPQIGGKTDLIPNHPNSMWMDPKRAGVYLGQCAQFCALQHAMMMLRVSVDSRDDFAAWAMNQQQPGVQDAKVAASRHVFETQACINYDSINGTSGTGRFGPDLTPRMSRATLASGAGDNTPENLRRWIKDPAAFKKGALMPAMQMEDAQLDEMVAYLELLDVGYQKHVIDPTSRRQ